MKLLFLLLLSLACTATISGQTDNVPAVPTGIKFENRENIPNAPRCNASEAYIKKKVKAHLANYYTEYPHIAVDFSSFKAQHGYNDKEDPQKIIYPYKIEMLVYLKRPIVKEGKEYTEYSIWKYDCVYEYASKPGKKCEFNLVPSSQKILVTRQEF